MKIILLICGIIPLLATTGCLVSDRDRHEHARYEHRDEVIVGPPVLEVRPPEIIVR